jgi:chromosome segregation ATPase
MRQLQQQQASLQEAQAQAEAQRQAAQQALDATRGDLSSQKAAAAAASRKAASLSKALADTTAERDALKARVAELEASLQRSTEQGQVCQATLGQARVNLGATNRDLSSRLGQCLKDNQALVVLGQDLLERYENKGFGEVLGAKEPFIQSGRVKLENQGQEIRAKLEALQQ